MKTKTDRRYTIAREFTGNPHGAQYVARFADERIGEAATREAARILAASHAFKRAADGVTNLRVIPAMGYELAGTCDSLSPFHVYPATVAENQPDHLAREAVFVRGLLLERGEYFVTPTR
jgi:hypothetical protein